MTSKETLKLQIAADVAADAFAARRRREEREYRVMQGWGWSLTESQYAAMNRCVNRIMMSTPESAMRAIVAAQWELHEAASEGDDGYDAVAEIIEVRE